MALVHDLEHPPSDLRGLPMNRFALGQKTVTAGYRYGSTFA